MAFATGDRVFWPAQNREGMVARTRGGFCEVYFGPGNSASIREADLFPVLSLLESLSQNELDSPAEFDLRTLAHWLSVAHAQDPRASIANSRLEPQPHQVFVAHKAVTTALYPRMLLADDVGLGKTIEAGLIIKELKARELVRRILILPPASLVTQWEREMNTKFNERFTVFDSARERIYQNDNPGENVYSKVDQVICSLQLARDEQRAAVLAEAEWDLVIFDEAHHVRRSLDSSGERARKAYQLAVQINDRTKGMLLLTATPLQLQDFEFYSLLELLDPSVFPTYEDFTQFRRQYAETNRLIGLVQEYHRLTAGDRGSVDAQLKDWMQSAADAPAESQTWNLNSEYGREQAVKALSRNHRMSDLMIRNRKRAIGGFTSRRVHQIPVTMTQAEADLYRAMRDYIRRGYSLSLREENRALGFVMVVFQKLLTSSPYALVQALQRRIDKLEAGENGRAPAEADEEVESDEELSDQFEEAAGSRARGAVAAEVKALKELRDRARRIESDSKLAALNAVLQHFLTGPAGKVLIFTQFRETLEYLRQCFEGKYRVVTFHGGMDARAKDDATEAFRSSAQIMIATEAGGEGRNFQFCNLMVNYDLPWNPMKIEQRIGRLDRIGQKRDVFIYNFAIEDTIEQRILEVLEQRIKVFEETVGGMDPILGDMERDLIRLMMEEAADFDREIAVYQVELEDRIRRVREVEARMADFLMDWASLDMDKYRELMKQLPAYQPADLESFLRLFFERLGSPVRSKDGGILEISPPSIWETEHPDLYQMKTIRGTCNPKLATDKTVLEFFAFGHRVVDAALQACLGPRFPGRVTSRLCPDLTQPGQRLLQCTVLLQYVGVRQFKRLVPICINLDDLSYDAALSEEVFRCPSDATPGPRLDDELQRQLQAAWEVAELEARGYLERLQPEIEAENAELCAGERDRLLRLYAFKLHRANLDIERNVTILRRLEASASEADRRVLPIYRSQGQELQSGRRLLEEQREQALARLDQQRLLSPSYAIEAAALAITI